MATQCTVQPEKQRFKEVLRVTLRALQSDSRVFRRLLGRGWLGGLPTPAVVLCAGTRPAFALDTPCLLLALQKWELGFESFFLHLVVHHLGQLLVYTVIFSSL